MPIEIALYIWSLATPLETRNHFASYLTDDETARMGRFVYDKHRFAFLAARGGLRDVLGRLTNVAPADLRFSYGPQGKPALAGGPAFNLSHSGNLACLAVHSDLQIGVDIEEFRPIEQGLAERFFSATEIEALATLPEAEKEAGFFRCWTRKEALVKGIGGGLSIPLDAFDVSIGRPAAQLLRLYPTYGRVSDWAMAHFELGPTMVGAVAAKTGGAPISLRVIQCPASVVFSG